MAWFEDLSPWTYVGIEHPLLKAVGWLSEGHAYSTGHMPEETYHQLCRLLHKPWTPWGVWMGFHDCEFCRFSGGIHEYAYSWHTPKGHIRTATLGGKSNSELIIPGSGCLYVTPHNIAHYIDSHGYTPPSEFLEAVAACPDVDSIAYKKAFLANGGREVLQAVKSMNPFK